jgi:glycosyltransferase involved in cell wall biosynthesis
MSTMVSILIPAYNAENWVRECIESALSQTWSNKEIIIVDDGSRDNTFEIASAYGSKNVKVVTQENSGACKTRNKALSLAQGDYIQWLDADDVLHPEKIAIQIKEAIKEGNRGILYSSKYGKFFTSITRVKYEANGLWEDLDPIEWIIRKFRDNLWMQTSVWLVSRELTMSAGDWDERLSLDDDGEYFCRVVALSEKVRFITDAIIYYRIGNAGSLSRTVSKKACESLLSSLRLCFGYLLSLENSARTREACLKELQREYIYFYPEHEDLIRLANSLAKEMGGILTPPHLDLRYSIIKAVMGWKTAKDLMRALPAYRLRINKCLDNIVI